MKKINKKKLITSRKLLQQMKRFEKDNPSIADAMKTLDISMTQYEQVLRASKPTKIFTSSSTKVL